MGELKQVNLNALWMFLRRVDAANQFMVPPAKDSGIAGFCLKTNKVANTGGNDAPRCAQVAACSN